MPSSRRDDALAAVTVVTGGEEFLVERVVAETVAAARAEDPGTELTDLEPGALEPSRLAELASPSLFGDRRVLVVRGTDALAKDAVRALTGVLADPPDGLHLVLVHAGGKRGKALLDAAAAAGARRVDCPPVKRYAERLDFVRTEARRAGGGISEDGARALLDTVGTDLRELAMACAQLVADSTGADGRVGADTVARYYRGRAEATSFTVADRAIEGRAADALEHLRWALATGVAPVLVTGALAQSVRSVAMVRGSVGLRPAELAQQLRMPPWKVDRARRQARGWTDEGLSRAVQAVAEADARVKGEAADPAYALERAVVTVARCARA